MFHLVTVRMGGRRRTRGKTAVMEGTGPAGDFHLLKSLENDKVSFGRVLVNTASASLDDL